MTLCPPEKKTSIAQNTASILLILITVCFFTLDDSKYKTIIYILLPTITLLSYHSIVKTLKQHQTALLFLTATLGFFSISSLWSQEPELIEQLKYSLLTMLLFSSILECSKSFNYRKIINILFYATSLFTIALAITFIYKHKLTIPTGSRLTLFSLTRLSENNPISSGVILGAIVLLAINQIKNSKTLWQLALIFFVSSTAFLLLMLTKSRGPLIALIFATTLLALANNDKKTYRFLAYSTIALALFLYFSNIDEILRSRMEQENYRLWIWSFVLQSMEGHWLFGHGLGSNAAIPLYSGDKILTTVTHSHSSLLDALRTGGLIGTMLFSSMSFYLLYKPLKQREDWFFLVLFIFGFICVSTNGRFPLMRPNIEWFAFWLPLFFWYAYQKHEAKEQP